MQLKIKNKWISLGGSSYITDMEDNHIYEVKGKIFTFTAKKFFKDLEGNVLYVIRNKFWRLFTRRALIYDKDNNLVCRVSKKYLSVRSKFIVDQYKEEIIIDGNILDFNFDIRKNGVSIGHLSRMISLRDSFELTIPDGEDAAFVCALVIAIDNILDRRNSEGSRVSFSSGD
ncbi:MAG: LURP-one-related family protein [Gammaproteobacteria bacterium]|nr:LURP-one-related family protein [Gammaproteobacteria bacterium]